MSRYLTAVATFVLAGIPAMAGPLHDAVKKGEAQAARKLIDAGEDINESHRNFGSPLHIAAIWSDANMALLLINAGADVNAEHRIFGRPLNAAAQKGNLGVVEVLLANSAEVDGRTRLQTTALHAAAEGGHIEIVKSLLANGADQNARSADGFTPIHLAGRKGHYGVVGFLSEWGTTAPEFEPIDDLMPDADVVAGEVFFGSPNGDSGDCFGCHDIAPSPAKKVGPNLIGIFNERMASVVDYNYSRSFQRLNGTWSLDELNAFIASPTDHVPGTTMEVAGVSDASMRANVIAYIQSFGER